MELLNIFLMAMGVCIVVFGIILMTRRIITIRRIYFNVFLMVMVIIPQMILGIWSLEILLIFSALFLIMLLLNFIFTDKYVTYNINEEIARKVLPSVLDDEGISYSLNEDAILLESENKFISYILSQNTLDIDFQKIRKMSYYKKIKREFFSRVKGIEKIQKPTSGPVYLLVGIGLVVFGFFVEGGA